MNCIKIKYLPLLEGEPDLDPVALKPFTKNYRIIKGDILFDMDLSDNFHYDELEVTACHICDENIIIYLKEI